MEPMDEKLIPHSLPPWSLIVRDTIREPCYKTNTFIMNDEHQVANVCGLFTGIADKDDALVMKNAEFIVAACNAYGRLRDLEVILRLIIRAQLDGRQWDVEMHIREAGKIYAREMAERIDPGA